MQIACAACNDPMTLSVDQVGKLVRCPGCQTVMKVMEKGVAAADEMVTCPGCKNRLVIPDSTRAKAFRCPKCLQHLVTQQPVLTDTTDDWSVGMGGDPLQQSGTSTSSRKPVTQSSTPWNKRISYPDDVGSVAPGTLIVIHACIGLLLCAVQFFYAMGITDPERLVEEDVRNTKLTLILSASLGGLYLGVLALGGVQMILRQRLWYGRIVCILATFPLAIYAYGTRAFWVGVAFYPLSLMGGVWGLIVLFSDRTRK